MGQDLLLAGWTYKETDSLDGLRDKVATIVDTIANGATQEEIDTYFGDWCDMEEFDREQFRGSLGNGVNEYLDAVAGHRFSVTWNVRPSGGTYLVLAGGSSWGDDPFDGWGDLVRLLEWLEAYDSPNTRSLAEALGFLGIGVVVR